MLYIYICTHVPNLPLKRLLLPIKDSLFHLRHDEGWVTGTFLSMHAGLSTTIHEDICRLYVAMQELPGLQVLQTLDDLRRDARQMVLAKQRESQAGPPNSAPSNPMVLPRDLFDLCEYIYVILYYAILCYIYTYVHMYLTCL